jgi:hypothetical protein
MTAIAQGIGRLYGAAVQFGNTDHGVRAPSSRTTVQVSLGEFGGLAAVLVLFGSNGVGDEH